MHARAGPAVRQGPGRDLQRRPGVHFSAGQAVQVEARPKLLDHAGPTVQNCPQAGVRPSPEAAVQAGTSYPDLNNLAVP